MFAEQIARAQEMMDSFYLQQQKTVEMNTAKVLDAMRKNHVSEQHLKSSTGYGYNDMGRDTLEMVWADVFRAEAALMRQQIISGTHAISLALAGNLLPGDELLVVGKPYDTLYKVIGYPQIKPGSLREIGITYREIDFDFFSPDYHKVCAEIRPETKMLYIQRSKGYHWRPALTIEQIAIIIKTVRAQYPDIIIFVDNCYGEFVEEKEPIEVGANLIAGSLIKNPGAGLTPCGGYIAGDRELVERAAYRLNMPGVGFDAGPSLMDHRLYYQGLFLAPMIVGESLCGAVYAASLWQALGYDVLPKPQDKRSDIVQIIRLKDPQLLLAFCQEIQHYGPVDSFVTPEPWAMPGYSDEIVMAAGSFIQGSSIELSADAPMKEPYYIYLQAGLNRYHAKIALNAMLENMVAQGLLIKAIL